MRWWPRIALAFAWIILSSIVSGLTGWPKLGLWHGTWMFQEGAVYMLIVYPLLEEWKR